MTELFDVVVIGGGINGCGCAADAALRGLNVLLVEQDDLSSKTSSSSTKLIHGGLRYLEHYEFKLVKKALEERQVLLSVAPHLVHPQEFLLPFHHSMRPAWFLRLGLFIYDNLSRKNKLPSCKTVKRKFQPHYFAPLKSLFNKAFLFFDAKTDDARLTISNALQAKQHGASIRPHSKVIEIQAQDNIWTLCIQPKKGAPYRVHAKALINAAGPWVEAVAAVAKQPLQQKISLVKGSHIVVPKLYEGEHAYFLQHDDQRVVFVIPYHSHTMIGTTDVAVDNLNQEYSINEDEINYLTALVNNYFKTSINASSIRHSWSGVRPLITNHDEESPQKLSRDYAFEFSNTNAPMISILGGKITTYRQLAVEAIDSLKPVFPKIKDSITKSTSLPGASFNSMDFSQYQIYATNKYQWMDKQLFKRYLSNYGTNIELLLQGCTSMEGLGIHFGSQLYQAEVDYLLKEEWASSLTDILQRRTKLGLTLTDASIKRLLDYLEPQRF